jgi:hypothetical protein
MKNAVSVRAGRESYGIVAARKACIGTAELLQHNKDNYSYVLAVVLQLAATLSDRLDKGIR